MGNFKLPQLSAEEKDNIAILDNILSKICKEIE